MIPNSTFFDLIDSMQRYAPATRLSYRTELRFFATFLGDLPLCQATHKDAFAYMLALQRAVSCYDGKPLAPKTLKRKLLSLFKVYELSQDFELIERNPFHKVAKAARDIRIEFKRETKIIEFSDVRPLIEATECPRNRAIFAILYGGGVRVSELVGIRKSHVVFLDNDIGLHILTSKKKKETWRPVLLPAWAAKFVRGYLSTLARDGDDWLFPSPQNAGKTPISRKWVSILCRETFGSSAHSARSTHVSYLLVKGVPVREVQRAVGHASITSTILYDKRVLKFHESACIEADFTAQKNILATAERFVYRQ